MSKFEAEILGLIEQQPGLTDRQITDYLKGKAEGQQYVNQTCHLLEIRRQLVRRKRDDGLIGNYLADPAKAHSPPIISKNDQIKTATKEPDRRAELLLSAGFETAGRWAPKGEDIKLLGELPKTSGVYAFCVEANVVYVGLASRSLRQRLYGYEHPGSSQRTNVRVQHLIQNEIEAGKTVEVLTACPGKGEWNGLPVDFAPGLEAGLVRRLKPPWNKQGV